MTSPPIRTLLRMRVLALLGVLVIASAACGTDSGGGDPALSGIATTTAAPTTTTAPDGPSAIISLSPTATEILFAIGAGDQVVAVDNMSNYPADAPVSGLSGFTPNVEAIAGYEPDLVVISYDPGDLVEGLEALEIPTVMQWAANSIDDTYSQITELGQLTGHAAEAEAVNASIRDGLAAVAGDPVGSEMTYSMRSTTRSTRPRPQPSWDSSTPCWALRILPIQQTRPASAGRSCQQSSFWSRIPTLTLPGRCRMGRVGRDGGGPSRLGCPEGGQEWPCGACRSGHLWPVGAAGGRLHRVRQGRH